MSRTNRRLSFMAVVIATAAIVAVPFDHPRPGERCLRNGLGDAAG